MITIFNKNNCIDICCNDECTYVKLAAQDLANDIGRVSLNNYNPKIVDYPTSSCIIIKTLNKTNRAEITKDFESFTIKTENKNIYITGNGYLGTMWGIYTFSEKYLGISPLYLFDDYTIKKFESLSIDSIDIEEYPKTFGFRGFFINDEDLLTDWIKSGGKRSIDYPFYHSTVDTSVIDKVVETALRLKINLMIPASFLDIDNPPEKAIADCVAKRGIFLSQHHIEPCGVSYFTHENYCKKHGLPVQPSFVTNRETMIEVWKYYAEKWSGYDNVVWQLGLRGKADRPVWANDNAVSDDVKERGNLISDAISTQYSIIKEATKGDAKYFSSTLWMEGSYLFASKTLSFPENTMILFSDIGINQMYGTDFYDIQRLSDYRYGIYYHVQYWGHGPHLAPLTGIEKLLYNLKTAKEKGDIEYCILNVSNIREFTYEIKAYSEMLWNMDSFSTEKYESEYIEKYFDGNKIIQETITEYYNAIAELDCKSLENHVSHLFNYKYDIKTDKVKNFVVKDGMTAAWGKRILNYIKDNNSEEITPHFKEIYDAVRKSSIILKTVIEKMKVTEKELNENQSLHYRIKWINSANIIYGLYSWYCAIYEAYQNPDECKEKLNQAINHIKNILEYRKCAEYGDFKDWYRGDTKLKTKSLISITQEVIDNL